MTAPFAAAQARANDAVLARLSNAQADFGSGAVNCLFDNAYVRADVGPLGMDSTGPAITDVATSDVPASPRGKSVTVDGVAYKIAGHEPDGTGLSVVLLEKAA